MEKELSALTTLHRLNTDLLLNCLEGLSDEEAARRSGEKLNSIGYLVLHLIDARHFLASQLGAPLDNPVTAAVGENTKIDDIAGYPSLDELRTWWISIGTHLDDALVSVDQKKLCADATPSFPIEDSSILGEVAFFVHHDTYHIGQISLIRRERGHDAMSYKRRS